MNYDKLKELIDKGIFSYHHDSLARGYIKVNEIKVYPYKGKFGEGYTVETHCNVSTQYHKVTYYIKRKEV